MELTPKEVTRLLQALCEATRQSPDSAGFDAMENAFLQKGINTIGKRYLQENLLRPLKKPEVLTFSFQAHKLDAIASFLGFPNFLAYKEQSAPTQSLTTQQQSLVGSYLSIVRCNSGHSDLLVSPAEIYMINDQLFITLTSPTRILKGPVKQIAECLYITISDQLSKEIHIVLKVGNAIHPQVMQGVYSGVNSAGVPIAGRELFVRKDLLDLPDPSQPTNRLPIDSAMQLPQWAAIGAYFSEYRRNNVKVRAVARFDLTDLLLDDL